MLDHCVGDVHDQLLADAAAVVLPRHPTLSQTSGHRRQAAARRHRQRVRQSQRQPCSRAQAAGGRPASQTESQAETDRGSQPCSHMLQPRAVGRSLPHHPIGGTSATPLSSARTTGSGPTAANSTSSSRIPGAGALPSLQTVGTCMGKASRAASCTWSLRMSSSSPLVSKSCHSDYL